MQEIFNNFEVGDKRIVVERDGNGMLYLTNNASDQELVVRRQYLGWEMQRDVTAAAEWVSELTEMFNGNRALALLFAGQAGAKLTPDSVDCNRCGLPVDLTELHPNSLEVLKGASPDSWYVVHGDGDQCGEDQRAWITQ